MLFKQLKRWYFILLIAVVTAGCRLIDDDLSVCGADYLINYQVRLVTEIHATIDERLSSDIEKEIADTLKRWSDPVFSGIAHDLDMSFYSLDGTDELNYHTYEIIDATQKSYTLYIPREDYMHLAVVNTTDNGNVSLSGVDNSATMQITQRSAEVLPSHPTAIYTARLEMLMPQESSKDLSFDVNLYMASCASALVVINGDEVLPKVKEVLVDGMATEFSVRDSIFRFNHPSLIYAERVTDECFAAVSLPSRDFIAASGSPASPMKADDNGLWRMRVYVQVPDGTVTENILSVPTPLRAGTIDILRVKLHDDGSLEVVGNANVGVSVKLDWNEGDEYEVITG